MRVRGVARFGELQLSSRGCVTVISCPLPPDGLVDLMSAIPMLSVFDRFLHPLPSPLDCCM